MGDSARFPSWTEYPRAGDGKYAGLLYLPVAYVIAITLYPVGDPRANMLPFLLTGGMISVLLFFLKPLERIVLGLWLVVNTWVRKSFWSPFVGQVRAGAFSTAYFLVAMAVWLLRPKGMIESLRLTESQAELALAFGLLTAVAVGFLALLSFFQFANAVAIVSEYYGLQSEWAFNKPTLPPRRLEDYLSLIRSAMERNDWEDANLELRKIRLRYHLFFDSGPVRTLERGV